MNDNFSWKRFGCFAQAELTGERRNLLLKLGGFVVFCLVIYMLWNIKVIFGGGSVDYNGGLGYVAPRFFIAMGMGFIVYFNLSGSFKRYFLRERASEAFMLPVAKSEKFLYATLLNVIVVPVVLIGIALLNDLIWAKLLGFDNIFKTVFTFSEHTYTPEQGVFMSKGFLISNMIGTLSGMAFFLAGAVVFRRNQFLFTLLVNFVLSAPIFVFTQVVFTTSPDAARDLLLWMGTDAGIWTVLGSSVCFVSLWVYIAWRRFSTLQITR